MRLYQKLSVALIIVVAIMVTGAMATETISFEVKSTDYQVSKDSRGGDVIRMDGFKTNAAPGAPLLPRKVLDVALPPSVNWDSVVVRAQDAVEVPIDGLFNIAPAGPDATWPLDSEILVDWADAGQIVDGKDVSIYGVDANHPRTCASNNTFSQMRKWKFVRVEFTPFAINPVTGQLTLTESARIAIQFETDGEPEPPALLRDTVMDDKAKRRFINFDEAASWYQLADTSAKKNGKDPVYDYVIITTNAIEAGSAKLSDFVTHKTALGFSVLVITEDEFGSMTGQTPNGISEKIRQWLIENYASCEIKFVLFIGDPDPDAGGVPMKMCWPRRNYSSYKEAPTDYFYADLTGDWDLDGDTYFGEYSHDQGTGGIDLTAEVYVGRIPVYDEDYGQLDDILQKTMDYQAASGDLSWRKKILLPESFSDSSTDGAYLGECIMDDFGTSYGLSPYKLYQQGACTDDSSFSSDEELVSNATWNHWKAPNPYGLVTWWAHGNTTIAAIGYSPNNCGTLLATSNCPTLDDTKPAIVYQCSCLNAYPESTSNLSYALLKSGAISAVGASRVSWYSPGWTAPTGSLLNNELGYEMDRNMAVHADTVGEALATGKAYLTVGSPGRLMNAFVMNMYGDPQVHYNDKQQGTDYCVDGNSGSDTNGGSSWTDAFKTIQHAIDECGTGAAGSPDTVHVAAYTYYENIELDDHIRLWGGYPAGGGARNPALNETIIDGSNSGIVVHIFADEGVTVDGFTIQNGYSADGAGLQIFECDPMISNNRILSNHAWDPSNGRGGGIYCGYASPTLQNNIIMNNVAETRGGGIYSYRSWPTIINCLVAHNDADVECGGIYMRAIDAQYECAPEIINCTIADNNAPEGTSGAGVYAFGSHCNPVLLNSIVWHNGHIDSSSWDDVYGVADSDASYCDISTGSWTGAGMLNTDPIFVPINETPFQYYLVHTGPQAVDSPCLDAGEGTVTQYGMHGTTTCTDGSADGDDDASGQTGPIDMGYHYPQGYDGNEDTYIDLVSFEARPGNASLILTWETGAEIRNAGFVLFRTIAGESDYIQLSGLIGAEGTPASGASYLFIDNDAEAGISYDYWLVDVETTGKWTAHGPASARLPMGLKLFELPTVNYQLPTTR
ncbi:hypothetical protein J7M28_02730 [bacterium]|nr:hypothetical protein [bacterium]